MIAIETKNISKAYGEMKAVDDVSISVNKGEVYSLLGMNGAGKSTLIKILCGLIEPTSGGGSILGYDLLKETNQIKEVIAVSPQETAIAPNLTVYENLDLMAGLNGDHKAKRMEIVEEIMDRLSLEPYRDQRSKTLSGGWQRRLSIAMALVSEPDILFLDEPTLGLDVLARQELWEVIRSLKGKVTIILTTHYLEEARSLSDRICILQNGKIKALGTADELVRQTNTATFEDAFVKLAKEEAAHEVNRI